MIEEDYYGWSSAVLANEKLEIRYLTEAGPRVVGFGPAGGPNLLARTPDVSWDVSGRRFHLMGGHRFWYAPEVTGRSDWPDTEGLKAEETPTGVRLIQQPDPYGISKELVLELVADEPHVRVTHVLRNESDSPTEIAPWSITQMALGGTALLPQATMPTEGMPLFPNRGIVIWPYSKWNDQRIVWGDPLIRVEGLPGDPPLKIGYFNPHGWLGYQLDGWVFVKRWIPSPGAKHTDEGSNAEIYVNDVCLELEALAPLEILEPDETVRHVETWEVFPVDAAEERLRLD